MKVNTNNLAFERWGSKCPKRWGSLDPPSKDTVYTLCSKLHSVYTQKDTIVKKEDFFYSKHSLLENFRNLNF